MIEVENQPAGITDATKLEQEIRARIESLSYLPTTVAVAMKFIDLGKNPNAEPADYAKVISADGSLSTKLLALANSPWFGIRNKVTSVRMAVNLLGLGTVRTMAISYCMAGLHNELHLAPDEARMFWEGSLCKAVAAGRYAHRIDKNLADEAFVAGMFQDFALPIMFATAKEKLMGILNDPSNDRQAQVNKEREIFRLDHAEIGRILAQKLELPDVYVDAIAFHHQHERLDEFMEQPGMSDAVYAASLFPPLLTGWNRQDADTLCHLIEEQFGTEQCDPAKFIEEVQAEFDKVYRYFEGSEVPDTRLAHLMIAAARENADNTSSLIRTVSHLMQEAATMGVEMNQLVRSHNQLEDKAIRDPLTGLLNRAGFTTQAQELIEKAARYQVPLSLVYFDLDKFKTINDTMGHEMGDRALRNVATCMGDAARQHDRPARLGGDEFVMLLYDASREEAEQIVRKILAQTAAEPITRGKARVRTSLSAGLLHVATVPKQQSLDELLSMADKLMYQSKQEGGNRVWIRVVDEPQATTPGLRAGRVAQAQPS